MQGEKNHHDVSNQTAQTATKQCVHPKSRPHYSTALKIKGEKEKEEEQVKSHFVVLLWDGTWTFSFLFNCFVITF